MKIAALIILFIIIVYILVCFSSYKLKHTNPGIEYAMKQLNLTGSDYKTLIVSAMADINTSPEQAWNYIIKTDGWKRWQHPLIQSIRSSKDTLTKTGDKFEQLLDLGFPLGSVISKEIIDEYKPEKILSWKKDEKGIKSCHVWLIEPSDVAGIRVYNCEVFFGSSIPYFKMLVSRRWNRLFMQSVAALKKSLEK